MSARAAKSLGKADQNRAVEHRSLLSLGGVSVVFLLTLIVLFFVFRPSQFTSLAGPAHRSRLDGLSAALDPDDAINIQFTSGTTGAPKGATLTHFNIVNNARYAAKAMALSAEDRLCIPVPLYHCFGMVLGVLTCTAVGAGMV